MRNKIIPAICAVMMFVPWTILPLRAFFQWALDYAHIMVPSYAAFMIFSAIFTIVSYVKAKVRNTLMKVCLVVNSAYGVFGIGAIAMLIAQKFM